MARVLDMLRLLVLVFPMALAAEPSPLQDFCVADLNGQGIIIVLFVFSFCLFEFLLEVVVF